MNLMLAEQAYFDQHEFDTPGYVELSGPNQKVRHILLHSVKAAGKLAIAYDDGDDLRITHEVIPDLAIYRSQLINTLQLDMTPIESFELREPQPGEGEGVRDLLTMTGKIHLDIANYRLAEYVEQHEHGRPASVSLVQVSAELIQRVAATLALAFEIDLPRSQIARMESILGYRIPKDY